MVPVAAAVVQRNRLVRMATAVRAAPVLLVPEAEQAVPEVPGRRHHRLPAVALATVPAVKMINLLKNLLEETALPAVTARAREYFHHPEEDIRLTTTPISHGADAAGIPHRVAPMPRYKNV